MINVIDSKPKRSDLRLIKRRFMKGLIIYKSKYGATRQYAHWIGNDLNFAVVDVRKVMIERLKQSEVIIIGSSIYMGKALIRRWLRAHKRILHDKLVFIFLVSGTPAAKTVQLEKYMLASVPAELRNNTHTFFFPGKIIYKKLSWPDRFLLNMGARLMKKDGEKNILADYDEVKRDNINELVATVKNEIAKQTSALQEPEGSFPV